MESFLAALKAVNNAVNSVIWGIPMLLFITFIGLLYSFRLKFFQVTKFRLWVKATFGSLFKREKNSKKSGISSFQAMSTALAAAIGTGNIVGVATAITLGGPGAVFWMWVAAFFGMMTSFAENALGVVFRTKNNKGQWVGGPMYYIEKGLGQKWMGKLFAVACMIAALGIGNMTQSNSITGAAAMSFGASPAVTAAFVCIITGIVIFGGIKRIAGMTEAVVPFMALFYIIGCIAVIAVNYRMLPSAFSSIFNSAFGFNSAAAGAGGYGISLAVKYGISRGVFSNEAGLGSSPIVHAASEEYDPLKAGMWGIFQVFIDTVIVCSLTALCILTTGAYATGADGVELSAAAFQSVFGGYGETFMTVSVLLFAFATLISWSYYGERCLEYLCGGKFTGAYKLLYIACAGAGCLLDLRIVWDIADTFNGIMAAPNLIALLFLFKYVKKVMPKR